MLAIESLMGVALSYLGCVRSAEGAGRRLKVAGVRG
jgi:hypothetical protein